MADPRIESARSAVTPADVKRARAGVALGLVDGSVEDVAATLALLREKAKEDAAARSVRGRR